MSIILRTYNKYLATHPYLTNSAIAGTLWFAGDVLSQTLEQREFENQLIHPHSHRHRKNQHSNESSAVTKGVENTNFNATNVQIHSSGVPNDIAENLRKGIDWKRVAIMSSFGFAFAGPLYQFWYSLLDRKLVEHWMKKKLAPGVSITPQKIKWRMSLQKVIADMFLFDPPYLAFFFITTNVMSGYTFQQSTQRMKRDALPTYWVDVAVWTPIQFLNFRFIPVSYQPLVVNGVNVFWNAYLSYVKHK